MQMNELRKRRRVAISFGESMTEQSHKKSCDINTILNRYKKTGIINHINNMQGKYEDYPSSIDFHLMQTKIAVAKSMFESIPSNIRAKFENDPGKFLDFASNPENREAMLEMGFSEEHLPEKPETPASPEIPVEPAPEPAPVATPTPPEPNSGPV